MNDMTGFMIKTGMSLLNVNLAIITYIIQDIHMILYNVLIVINHNFRK